MSKIKRAFVVTEKSSYGLLKTINSGRLLSEDEISPLAQIYDAIFKTPADSVTLVARLSREQLQNEYLVAGGGTKLIQSMDDASIQKLIDGLKNSDSMFQQIDGDITLAGLIGQFNADDTVIMKVPSSEIAELTASKDKPEEAKKILSKMMSHEYYKATLINKRAKSIAAKVDGAETPEDKMKLFNPTVLNNFPNKQVLLSAKNQWAEENKTVVDLDAKKKEQEAQQQADHSNEEDKEFEDKSENPEDEQDHLKQAEGDLAADAQAKAGGEQSTETPAETPPAEPGANDTNATEQSEKSQAFASMWQDWEATHTGVTPQMVEIAKKILAKAGQPQ